MVKVIFSWAVAGTLLLGPGATEAGGFRIDEQGATATALGGAFVAQADDPSAVYYNPAGLSFLKAGGFAAGTSVQTLGELQFQGGSPGIAGGTSGELDGGSEILLHAYWVQPLAPNVVLGLGAFQPFFMKNSWANPETFSGRLLTTQAEIDTYDVNANLSLRLTKRFSLGVGAVYRVAEISHGRRLSRFNPLTGEDADVGTVAITTDQESGIGWNAGFLLKASEKLSFGASYRSAIDLTYAGAGLLTQVATGNSQFDTLIAATIPFGTDLPVSTTLELPDTLRVGFAFGLGKSATVEVDADWTGWSSVQSLPFEFTSEPSFSQTIDLRLDDAVAYRFGLRLKQLSGAEFRFGFVFEESAQTAGTLNPFLADADTNAASFGWGKDWLGIALKWTERTDATTRTNPDDFNGTYSGNQWSATLALKL